VTSAPPDKKPATLPGEIRDLRKDLVRLLALAIPTALVQFVVKKFQDGLSWEPWQSLWILVPLAVLAWILWQLIKGRMEFRLHGPFLAFFVCYVLLFDLAASSDLLNWKRVPSGYDPSVVPSNFALPAKFGDWRYRLLSPSAPRAPISVVLLTATDNLLQRRTDLATLIQLAALQHAKGIGLDFYFSNDVPASMQFVNELFCQSVENASKQGVPVFFGYTFDVVAGGEIRRQPPPTSLPCIAPDRSGHIVVLQDIDSEVRQLPLYFRGDRNLPALSLRIANVLGHESGGNVNPPENGLLQFPAPSSKPAMLRFDELKNDNQLRKSLTDEWILAGEESSRDEFLTPFGKIPGVMIHAFAAESLLQHRYIQHLPAWIIFVLIFGVCYILTAFVAQGVPAIRLVQFAAVCTIAIIFFAAASMWQWRVWVDTIYFISAVWILLSLLLTWRSFHSLPAERGLANGPEGHSASEGNQ
jgi:CHASE2 domain-containing sensor protein